MTAAFEWVILDWFQSIRTPFGDWLMPLVTFFGEAGWAWIALAAVLLIIPKTRRVGAVLALALILDLIVTDLVIKNIFARPRPFEQQPGAVDLLVDPPWGHSFPSGHTAAAFAAVSALYFSRSRLWIPALCLASAIAMSRLYLFVHFPTDVLAGMIIGIVIGYCAWWFLQRLWKDDGVPPSSIPGESDPAAPPIPPSAA